MSTTQYDLSSTFPNVLAGTVNQIRHCVKLLIDYDRSDGIVGSPFAVTMEKQADGQDGPWHLWMSEVSYEFLCKECNWT